MLYVKCCLSNFIYRQSYFPDGYNFIFGKLHDGAFCHLTKAEAAAFANFLNANQTNFTAVEWIPDESFEFDLFDPIRHIRSLPGNVVVDPSVLALCDSTKAVHRVPLFKFIPQGIRLEPIGNISPET